jgi:hypothetical protein
VLGGRPYVNVGNEVILGVVERLDAVPQGIELVGRELAVDRAPGNGILGGRFFDDETVSRRTTSAPVSASTPSPRCSASFTSSSTLRSVYTVLLACVMRYPIRPEAECSKRFVVVCKKLLQRKKWPDYARKAQKK